MVRYQPHHFSLGIIESSLIYMYDIQLDPPVGTCYFKSYECSLSEEWKVSGILIGKAKMEVTFYIYVTLVKPTDPKFTEKGGKVYIVAVCNGSASTITLDFGVEDLSGKLSVNGQLPVPGAEVKRENTRVYTIDFAQSMSMFNNGGNSGYTFPARYKRDFCLTGFHQSNYELNNWSLRSAAKTKKAPVLNGLHIFQTNRLTKAKIRLFVLFRVIVNGIDMKNQLFSKEFEIDFSAETMAQAVVG